MCLGVPGRVSRWIDRDPLFARATVEFGEVQREVHMACVTEAEVGDYVIVHAGVAICILDQAEAEKTIDTLAQLGDLDEFGEDWNHDEIPG